MYHRRVSAALAATIILCTGCTHSNEPLSVSGLEPAEVPFGVATPIMVHGSGFYSDVQVTLDTDESPTVNRAFQITIADIDIPDDQIAATSTSQLDTITPMDLPVGLHTVVVTTPSGERRELPDALRVLGDPPPSTTLTVEDAATGQGQEVVMVTLPMGDSVTLHAITRTDEGDFVADEPVGWSASNANIALDVSTGTRVTVTALATGMSEVGAMHTSHGDAMPVIVNIPGECVLESTAQGNCNDGLDNDCDTLFDGQDPGCSTTDDQPPIASFHAIPSAGPPLTSFVLDATASLDPDIPVGDPMLTYRWYYDDGVEADATGPVVIKDDLLATGPTTIRLQVTDQHGMSDWFEADIIVVDPSEQLHVVTTDADNDNASDGVTSLREAITNARNSPGPDVITFSDAWQITLENALESVGTSGPVHIIGRPGVLIDCNAAGGSACIELRDKSSVRWVELINSQDVAIRADGDGNVVAHCSVHDNDTAIVVDGASAVIGPDNHVYSNQGIAISMWGTLGRVHGNRVHHNEVGVSLRNGVSNILVDGNIVYNNTNHGVEFNPHIDTARVWNNTIYDNSGDGIRIKNNTTGLDIRNNIIANHAGNAIRASGNGLSALIDYNNYFANGTSCNSCTVGPNAIQGADPLFVNIDTLAGELDLRIRETSMCRDAGIDVGIDINGGGSMNGLFTGAAPDIGAWELQ